MIFRQLKVKHAFFRRSVSYECLFIKHSQIPKRLRCLPGALLAPADSDFFGLLQATRGARVTIPDDLLAALRER